MAILVSNTFVIQRSQVFCANNTENFTSVDASDNTLQLVLEALVEIKFLMDFLWLRNQSL